MHRAESRYPILQQTFILHYTARITFYKGRHQESGIIAVWIINMELFVLVCFVFVKDLFAIVDTYQTPGIVKAL